MLIQSYVSCNVLPVLCRILFSIHDDGLRHILYHYGSTRSEVYKRLFAILWYGNHVGSPKPDAQSPTYIFPEDLRATLRDRFSGESVEHRDAEFDRRPDVHHVTWDEMKAAKWPKPPKACKNCSGVKSKPY